MSGSIIAMQIPSLLELIVLICIVLVPLTVIAGIVGIVILVLKLTRGNNQPPRQPPPVVEADNRVR
jgi:hypothetical protein